jgi:hypothetical protein
MKRALAAVGLLLAACATASPSAPTPRPPPASESRGYRALTPQGVDLVFDPKLQLYAVPSVPGAYWLDGRYYRRSPAGVERAEKLEGPWQPCPAGELPERLR